MVEEIKRAIDNNDINKLYACGFFMDSSIKEYIFRSRKRIIGDILNLKLWLDDELVLSYYSYNDFIKASIMVANIDVARFFDNEEINNFLLNNMNHIVRFMNEKTYVLSNKTPKILLNNDNFIKLCLDNGFINVLDYTDNDEYYLKNKERIDLECENKIASGIINIDEFSSKRLLSNSKFLISSIIGNHYNVLLFSSNSELDRYIEDNYKKLSKKIDSFIRNNNYFINKNVDIKLPFFLGIYKNLLNRDFKNRVIDDNFLKIILNKDFGYLVSYLSDDVILDVFGKKIFQLYSFFGIEFFNIGYDKICLLNSFSIIEYERFVKIFCFDGSIKMENIRNMYFSIIKGEFEKKAEFNENTAIIIENMIKSQGIIDNSVKRKIDYLKKILGSSYRDYLIDLIKDNFHFDLKKSFNELIDDVFDSYRRSVISLDDEKQKKLENVINNLCVCAYNREYDQFAASKMDFSDGYPFLVEPSDIYIKRVYKEKKLQKIKNKVLENVNLFEELCKNVYSNYTSSPYNFYEKDVKKYLKTNEFTLQDLNKNVDNYLSRYVNLEDIDSFYIEYFNLPLTDEYLKAYGNIKNVLSILDDIDISKIRFMLKDENYDKFKEILYDKQVLYMLDIFCLLPSFYNKKNLENLISNFYMLKEENLYDIFKETIKYSQISSLFNPIFGEFSDYLDNDSKYLGEIFNRCYKCLSKRSLPIPDISKKYLFNHHEITVSVGGYDSTDVFLPLLVNSDVMVFSKYDDLHNYIFSNENGFVLKFYDNKLIGLIFGIRYGNSIFLSNVSTIVHSSYIDLPLKKFINYIVDYCNKNGDNLRHVYLSGNGEVNKLFSLVNNLVSVSTDYCKKGFILYDDETKISSYSKKKYPINSVIYKGEEAVKRANMIKLIDLFGHHEENLINSTNCVNASVAFRSWYKNEDIFVIGPITDDIIEEVNRSKERINK